MQLRRLVGAAIHFMVQVFYQWITAMVLLLLHATNLYTTTFRDKLPIQVRDEADWVVGLMDSWAVVIAIALLVGSTLWAYFKLYREVRNPRITRKLKQFYVDLDELLARKVANDEEVEALQADVSKKENEIVDWVKANMERSALLRLKQREPSGFSQFRTRREDALSDEHGQLIDRIIELQRDLLNVIERTIWV